MITITQKKATNNSIFYKVCDRNGQRVWKNFEDMIPYMKEIQEFEAKQLQKKEAKDLQKPQKSKIKSIKYSQNRRNSSESIEIQPQVKEVQPKEKRKYQKFDKQPQKLRQQKNLKIDKKGGSDKKLRTVTNIRFMKRVNEKQLEFTVYFENGEEAIHNNRFMRKYYPDVLFDFYESHIDA